MAFRIKAKGLALATLMAMGATQVVQAEETNGFFMGLGYQQGKAGAYKAPLSHGFPIYGLGFQAGGVGFVNKWFGGRIYSFLDWNNSNQWGATNSDKWNLYTYGGAADAIVNFIATDPFSVGLVGGIQLAGTTWTYANFSHTAFQFLFKVGGRVRIMKHSAFEAGIKFPMVPQQIYSNMNMKRHYAWYVNYVYTF
ncbi:outer membrane protein [Helicobacter baculiformis]|uniref:Outer membrane protein n=1 Tax=Helicobacter baculiformis TaxID=427351 RepID=A0ABV7ZKF2_9HELI|nr:outer membrane protein [Helicobacter baculiformis]